MLGDFMYNLYILDSGMKDAAYNQRLYKFNYVVFATANDGKSLGYRFNSRDDLNSLSGPNHLIQSPLVIGMLNNATL